MMPEGKDMPSISQEGEPTDELSWLMLQLFQPYFYYPLVLSLALFFSRSTSRFTSQRPWTIG